MNKHILIIALAGLIGYTHIASASEFTNIKMNRPFVAADLLYLQPTTQKFNTQRLITQFNILAAQLAQTTQPGPLRSKLMTQIFTIKMHYAFSTLSPQKQAVILQLQPTLNNAIQMYNSAQKRFNAIAAQTTNYKVVDTANQVLAAAYTTFTQDPTVKRVLNILNNNRK